MCSPGCAAPGHGSPARTRSPPPAQRGAGSPAPLGAARRRGPGTAAASRLRQGEGSGAGLAPSPRLALRSSPHELPRWRGRRGSRCRGGRLPMLMVLGNPARASPSSPASSSRRVRGALCSIFFSPCGSAPKAKLAAQAWAQRETRSCVNGGGDAGGGGGEDDPPPFVSFFNSFLPQIPLLSSSPQSSRAHWLRDCLSPPSPAALPTQGLPPKMVGSGAAEAAPPGPGGGYRSNLA